MINISLPGAIPLGMGTKREERLQILTGFSCNNNCIFCMEDNREGRYKRIKSISTREVETMLDEKRGVGEVIFTSGEPTLNPLLPDYIALAKKKGYKLIGLVTNGRMLSYLSYCIKLLGNGLNHVTVSLHSTDRKIHESLTRTKGSYDQTIAAIRNLSNLKNKLDFTLNISFVPNKLNIKHIKDDYLFLSKYNIDSFVVNSLRPRGRAEKLMDVLMVRHKDIVSAIKPILENKGAKVCVNDIPLCVSEEIKLNWGFVEKAYLKSKGKYTTPNDYGREKGPHCNSCEYEGRCLGVWDLYAQRYGWGEFKPIRARYRQ